MMRRINLEKTLNTRDLGGYPTASGAYTAYNRFWRSDIPYYLSDRDIELLREKDITTVVDLRSLMEVEETPCHLSKVPGFSYHHCPQVTKMPESEEDVHRGYIEIVDDFSLFYPVMKAFADAPGGALFHCTAGKDRTGTTAALLLLLAGVAEADIIADYQITRTYIQPALEKMLDSEISYPAWAGSSKPEYMEAFLKRFIEKYHSVEEYLALIGLSAAEIDTIKGKLLGR